MDSHHNHGEDTRITLNVEGMTCAHCAMTVTKVLENNGAERPSVNFATGEANFSLPEDVKLEEIVSGITKAGYKVISQDESEVHSSGFSSLEKKFFFTLPFTTVLFFSHMLFSNEFILNNPYVHLLICLPVFIVGCMYFGKSAWNSLKVLTPNMDVLIMMGSGAAFVYSLAGTFLFYGSHEVHNYIFYETAATIITLVLLGNVIEHRSVKQTTSAIGELSKLQTATAKRIVFRDGKEMIHEVPIKDIRAGDILLVNTGDKIPVDGSVLSGNISADESMITGESMSVDKVKNDKLIGGTIAVNGALKMLAEKVGEETVLSKIIEMVKMAQQSKPEIQKLGDKVSNIFVPIVLLISIITFFTCHFVFDLSLQNSLMNSIAVLVISCPCAMGLATPTAVMVGIGRAAKEGVLIKGGNSLEEFARTQNIVFDKTGTLTTGNFRIKNIEPLQGATKGEIESILFHLEQRSSHPIARSIVSELENKVHLPISFSDFKESKGMGIEAKNSEGNFFKAGSYRMAAEITKDDSHSLYIFKNNLLIGLVDIEDEIKSNAKETISFFRSQGIASIMISGDRANRCREIADKLDIPKVFSEQLPDQKLKLIESFSAKGHTAMVGDGINDAPALAKASVGISIGNASQVAIHSSQIILLNKKDLSQLQTAYLISKHTLRTIKQNLFWAFFYNVVAIPIAAAGYLSPMVGALVMAFSDIIVIGNSLRLRKKRIY
ncbi:MAG: cadmium-translocating P-type ATPase [Bacteroidetes bacterium]|nr:MAG: cadmium-translocating P-type ATPase [Bacteroidota bacterium]